MAYEDRDYFREQQGPPKLAFRAPKLGRVTKGLLIGFCVTWFALLFIAAKEDFAAVIELAGKADDNANLLRNLALSPSALLPYEGVSSQPWQILSYVFVPPGVLSMLITCIVTVWLIGGALEEAMGSRRYGLFVLASVIATGVVSALADPFISGNAYSMGFAAPGMALFLGCAALLGDTPSVIGGLKYRTLVFILAGLSILFTAIDYAKVPSRELLHVVPSLPGAVAGCLFGWFGMKVLMNRGLSAPKRDVTPAEEDYLAYAHKLANNNDGKGDDTKVREADERVRVRNTARQQEEQAAVDALLERISKGGISSLSRSEKAFLERVSRRKKEAARR
jgi:membrane associated rhomboid family serine protease